MAFIVTSAEIDAWAGDDEGLSDELKEAMSLPDTDEGVIALVRLDAPGMSTPILVSSNAGEYFGDDTESKEPIHGTTYNGEQYLYCPFSLELLSSQEGGEISGASISIANVAPTLTATLREMATAINVTITILRKSDTSRAEMVVDFIKLVQVTITRESIRGDLSDYDYGSEPVTPNYTKAEYRGL